MKVSIVHPFLVESILMKHKITTRPNQPLLFFFFVETGSRRCSSSSSKLGAVGLPNAAKRTTATNHHPQPSRTRNGHQIKDCKRSSVVAHQPSEPSNWSNPSPPRVQSPQTAAPATQKCPKANPTKTKTEEPKPPPTTASGELLYKANSQTRRQHQSTHRRRREKSGVPYSTEATPAPSSKRRQ